MLTAILVKNEAADYYHQAKVKLKGDRLHVNAMNVSFILSSLRFVRKNATITSNHVQYLDLYKKEREEKGEALDFKATIRWKWLVGKCLECERALSIDYDQFVTFCWVANKLNLKSSH